MPRTLYGVVVQPGPDFAPDRPNTRWMLLEKLSDDLYTVPFGQVVEGTPEHSYIVSLIKERFIPHAEFVRPKDLHIISQVVVKSSEYHKAYIVDLKNSIDLLDGENHVWTNCPEILQLTPPTCELVKVLRRVDWL